VLVEAVLRELAVEPAHLGIARGLRQDGGRRDHPHFRVAIDDRAGRDRKRRATRAVEQHLVGGDRKQFHRASHGEQARLQDVQTVDFLHARPGDRPGERFLLDDVGEAFALAHANNFESAIPAGARRAGSNTTAAAQTGPASGPRPASSTPQIRRT